MLRLAVTLVAVFSLTVTGLAPSQAEPAPPVAHIAPTIFTAHGQRRIDNYYWLRDKNDRAVVSYLKSENEYAAARLAPLQPLVTELEQELRERADHDDASLLFADNRYIYRRRMAQSASFPLIVRRPIHGTAEQVVLDVERMAAGRPHYELAEYVISPDSNRVAFAVDPNGRRYHHIFVRNISTGEIIDTGIEDAASGLVFSTDSNWLFYIRLDPQTIRSYQLWRHRIGSAPSQDHLVYEESDTAFELHLRRSKSGKFIILTSNQQQSSEVRFLPAAEPAAALQVMEPRRRGMIYVADHVGDAFYIRSNLDAPDFRILRAPDSGPQAANWTEVIAESPGRLISEFEVFDSFVAMVEEADAIQSMRVFRFADQRTTPVPVPGAIGVTEFAPSFDHANWDAAATTLRIRFSGPLHPQTAYDFDTLTGTTTPLQRPLAEKWFHPSVYGVERINVPTADGEFVPITVTFRKDKLRVGGNPVLLTGYGAYGSSEAPTFPGYWMSLIDRGFVFAQAHVRGGQEKGSRWYELGRVLKKQNSFDDFIAAAEGLIARGYADPERIFARGASAGGLLVAVSANRRPDLFAGVVAEVPFVDVVTTMSDRTIPLTTLEYEEWGNPAVKEQFDQMMTYSPYDNVGAHAYPPMLVTGALHDSQVGFHEPAKWVARLRATKTDSNELLFVTSMDAGHNGKTGRFGPDGQNARIMAWLLAQAARPR